MLRASIGLPARISLPQHQIMSLLAEHSIMIMPLIAFCLTIPLEETLLSKYKRFNICKALRIMPINMAVTEVLAIVR